MYNFKDWKISDDICCIGSGAFWNVYRAFLKEEQSIGDFKFSQFIYKTSNGRCDTKTEIENNMKAYSHIRQTKLPTLAFYFQESYNGVDVIVGEDLNAGNLLFVSPNNAKRNDDLKGIKFNEDDNAEEQLMNNKITKILNFCDFINQIKVDMKEISRFNLGVCEAIFFFGTYKNKKESEIFYKIADFDTVMICNGSTVTKKMILENTCVMLNSLWEYVEQFVDSPIKKVYQNILTNEVKMLRK